MSAAAGLQNILNFRDVGETVNKFTDKRIVKEGVLYRSSRPDDATPSDRTKLKYHYGIKTVLDLRTRTEHLKKIEKRQKESKMPDLLKANPALAEPPQIPGLQYLEIQMTGWRFQLYMVNQLSWRALSRLLYNSIFGTNIDTICVITNEVMQPRGLIGMGQDTLDVSGSQIAQSLRAFIQPSSLPVLVHCTQGKDRTGLIVMLALMMLGVPTEAIAHDYQLTQEGLAADRETRLVEIEEIGLTPEWADCAPNFVQKMQEHIETKYGGINGYLDRIGFGSEDRKKFVQVVGA